MDHFTYRNRILHCDDVPVPVLAEKQLRLLPHITMNHVPIARKRAQK
jgi:hypothetical protein